MCGQSVFKFSGGEDSSLSPILTVFLTLHAYNGLPQLNKAQHNHVLPCCRYLAVASSHEDIAFSRFLWAYVTDQGHRAEARLGIAHK